MLLHLKKNKLLTSHKRAAYSIKYEKILELLFPVVGERKPRKTLYDSSYKMK